MDRHGFDFLRDAFKKFADKYDAEDLAGKVLRSAATGAKAAVDKGLEEFPKSFLKGLAADFYALLTSQEVADGVSVGVRAFDEEKLKGILDGAITQIKKNDMKIAWIVKSALSKGDSLDGIEDSIDALLSTRPPGERIVVKMFFDQAKPMLEEMKDDSQEEVAEKIKEMADTIPVDAIAQQVADLTREVTPERVAKQTHEMVGKLPSPGAVSDIVHGVGEMASGKLGRLAKSASVEDARAILEELTTEARSIVDSKIAADDASKKTFDKKGGKDFSL